MIVNVSPSYRNPDPFAADMMRRTLPMAKIVSDTVALFGGIPLRESEGEPNDQPEAISVVVVDYDGVSAVRLVTGSPAPQPGSAVHYESLLRRVCRLYEGRFSSSKTIS